MATTAILLCGGAGARMQGAEKPLLPLLGRPLLRHALDRILPQVDAALIVANREQAAYGALGAPVVNDGVYQGRGPLAGIAAGLAAANTEWVVSVPGDAPLLPRDLVQQLRQTLRTQAADLAVVHDGSGRQPLCCLLPRRLLPDLRIYLDGGGSAPREWQSRYRVAEADYARWPRWAWSLNTPEEWRFAEAQLLQEAHPP
jgi:molybdenum cofactor guanylyltransferase